MCWCLCVDPAMPGEEVDNLAPALGRHGEEADDGANVGWVGDTKGSELVSDLLLSEAVPLCVDVATLETKEPAGLVQANQDASKGKPVCKLPQHYF